MEFLRWLGGIAIIFCLIRIIFKIGGSLINVLIITAAIIFIVDLFLKKRKG
ncbi:hypothetical protein [Clostridium polynesiense]|uniref:hypothetical protein n=1 Tax=Clostridium polynesiense TaxID=1325933 RepID=UPI000AD7B221|nr:hypothetical protein [Clostridium polynesiense]